MPIRYMEKGLGAHVDRGLQAAAERLEPSMLVVDAGGDRGQHSRDMIEHVLALESERVPAVTAELFAEAIAVADAVREAEGKGPVNSFRARDFWEILKDLVDGVVEQ